MGRSFGLLLLLVSCAFPAPPPATVVNRAPFPANSALDRPFVVAVPVTGYELARFGFGVAFDKRYDSHKVLGHYLTAYDWKTGAWAGRTFWEGRGAGNGREVASESSGPRYVMGASGWSGLDPAAGTLTTGTFPPGCEPSGQVTADGRVVLVSRPDGYAQPAALRTFSLVTGQFLGPEVRFPNGVHRGSVTMFRTKLDAAGRFWIDTGNHEVYRYDPQTQELILAAGEALDSDHSLALLGAQGTSFLVSRYLLGIPPAQPTSAEILVFDAASPASPQSRILTLPKGGWISQGLDVQGTFYLQVSLPWDQKTPPVQQLWSFDPATGTATDTGLSLPLWGDGELLTRDQRIFSFSAMTETDTLTVGMADLVAHTVTTSKLSLSEAVKP